MNPPTLKTKVKPVGVLTISLVSHLRWSLGLSCGHSVLVTSKNQPTRKLWLCQQCERQ